MPVSYVCLDWDDDEGNSVAVVEHDEGVHPVAALKAALRNYARRSGDAAAYVSDAIWSLDDEDLKPAGIARLEGLSCDYTINAMDTLCPDSERYGCTECGGVYPLDPGMDPETEICPACKEKISLPAPGEAQ